MASSLARRELERLVRQRPNTLEQRVRRLEGIVLILGHTVAMSNAPMSQRDRELFLYALNDLMLSMGENL